MPRAMRTPVTPGCEPKARCTFAHSRLLPRTVIIWYHPSYPCPGGGRPRDRHEAQQASRTPSSACAADSGAARPHWPRGSATGTGRRSDGNRTSQGTARVGRRRRRERTATEPNASPPPAPTDPARSRRPGSGWQSPSLRDVAQAGSAYRRRARQGPDVPGTWPVRRQFVHNGLRLFDDLRERPPSRRRPVPRRQQDRHTPSNSRKRAMAAQVPPPEGDDEEKPTGIIELAGLGMPCANPGASRSSGSAPQQVRKAVVRGPSTELRPAQLRRTDAVPLITVASDPACNMWRGMSRSISAGGGG